MNNELIKRVEDKLLDTLLLAERLYKQVFELPKLSFELNSNRIAGQAFYYDWMIKINPKFLQSNSDHVVNVTVPHEVAHLVCHKVYPRAKQGHGPEWKGIMQSFGLKPETYHSMRLPNVKTYTYICNCQKFHLSALVHKRIQAGQRRHCSKCKKNIIFLD